MRFCQFLKLKESKNSGKNAIVFLRNGNLGNKEEEEKRELEIPRLSD